MFKTSTEGSPEVSGHATATPANSAPSQPSQGPTPVSAPTPTLPKGGGAIRGIGEKFSTSAATGTGGLSIPIAVSPGRGGFGPSLSLAYDSGAGNGPFGLGWSLDVPSITRKTDKKLPEYKDSEGSDVFLLSGAEDLVPVLDANGEHLPFPDGLESVERFRPRVEGLFARIERRRDTLTKNV